MQKTAYEMRISDWSSDVCSSDLGYGSSGSFRQALTDRGLLWAVGLSRRQNVYPSDVALIFPVASMGNKRKYHIPDQQPVSAETMLAKEKWKKVSWRRGTKGRLTRKEERRVGKEWVRTSRY